MDIYEGITDLENLFDQKVSGFKNAEQELSAKEIEVNSKYAKAYIQLVHDVLNEMKGLDEEEEISVRNDVIGGYFVESDDNNKKSTAILHEDGLIIKLTFDNFTETHSYSREKSYNEEFLNQLLDEANISVHFDGDLVDPYITIVYSRVKELIDEETPESLGSNSQPKTLGL